MRYLSKYREDIFLVTFGLLIAILVTYSQNIYSFISSPPCTPQQEVENLLGKVRCTNSNVYDQQVRFFSNPWAVFNLSASFISSLGLFLAGIILGLLGRKKWLAYCLILTLLAMLVSDNMRDVIWPEPQGMGKPLITFAEQNNVRWDKFISLSNDLPIALTITLFGGLLGRVILKIFNFSFPILKKGLHEAL